MVTLQESFLSLWLAEGTYQIQNHTGQSSFKVFFKTLDPIYVELAPECNKYEVSVFLDIHGAFDHTKPLEHLIPLNSGGPLEK